ncbi:hypothetical protein HK099_002818 [Clydaea vesicula]|uniref:Rho-GAP domain-containing protein n=1 Tax=Clydaea vesicula TaxID=447962 RepID=A0AAD5U2M0_9FUNG|nr:hypothetical protein HK099_002818 [Clydaea vesicula]
MSHRRVQVLNIKTKNGTENQCKRKDVKIVEEKRQLTRRPSDHAMPPILGNDFRLILNHWDNLKNNKDDNTKKRTFTTSKHLPYILPQQPNLNKNQIDEIMNNSVSANVDCQQNFTEYQCGVNVKDFCEPLSHKDSNKDIQYLAKFKNENLVDYNLFNQVYDKFNFQPQLNMNEISNLKSGVLKHLTKNFSYIHDSPRSHDTDSVISGLVTTKFITSTAKSIPILNTKSTNVQQNKMNDELVIAAAESYEAEGSGGDVYSKKQCIEGKKVFTDPANIKDLNVEEVFREVNEEHGKLTNTSGFLFKNQSNILVTMDNKFEANKEIIDPHKPNMIVVSQPEKLRWGASKKVSQAIDLELEYHYHRRARTEEFPVTSNEQTGKLFKINNLRLYSDHKRAKTEECQGSNSKSFLVNAANKSLSEVEVSTGSKVKEMNKLKKRYHFEKPDEPDLNLTTVNPKINENLISTNNTYKILSETENNTDNQNSSDYIYTACSENQNFNEYQNLVNEIHTKVPENRNFNENQYSPIFSGIKITESKENHNKNSKSAKVEENKNFAEHQFLLSANGSNFFDNGNFNKNLVSTTSSNTIFPEKEILTKIVSKINSIENTKVNDESDFFDPIKSRNSNSKENSVLGYNTMVSRNTKESDAVSSNYMLKDIETTLSINENSDSVTSFVDFTKLSESPVPEEYTDFNNFNSIINSENSFNINAAETAINDAENVVLASRASQIVLTNTHIPQKIDKNSFCIPVEAYNKEEHLPGTVITETYMSGVDVFADENPNNREKHILNFSSLIDIPQAPKPLIHYQTHPLTSTQAETAREKRMKFLKVKEKEKKHRQNTNTSKIKSTSKNVFDNGQSYLLAKILKKNEKSSKVGSKNFDPSSEKDIKEFQKIYSMLPDVENNSDSKSSKLPLSKHNSQQKVSVWRPGGMGNQKLEEFMRNRQRAKLIGKSSFLKKSVAEDEFGFPDINGLRENFIALDIREGQLLENQRNRIIRSSDFLDTEVEELNPQQILDMVWRGYKYLNSLEAPVLESQTVHNILSLAACYNYNMDDCTVEIKKVVAKLPRQSFVVLKAIIAHFKRLSAMSNTDITKGLGSLFGPILLPRLNFKPKNISVIKIETENCSMNSLENLNSLSTKQSYSSLSEKSVHLNSNSVLSEIPGIEKFPLSRVRSPLPLLVRDSLTTNRSQKILLTTVENITEIDTQFLTKRQVFAELYLTELALCSSATCLELMIKSFSSTFAFNTYNTVY